MMVGPQEAVVATRRRNQYQRPTRMYRHRRDVRDEGICGLTSALAAPVWVEHGVEPGGNALWPAPMVLGRSARPSIGDVTTPAARPCPARAILRPLSGCARSPLAERGLGEQRWVRPPPHPLGVLRLRRPVLGAASGRCGVGGWAGGGRDHRSRAAGLPGRATGRLREGRGREADPRHRGIHRGVGDPARPRHHRGLHRLRRSRRRGLRLARTQARTKTKKYEHLTILAHTRQGLVNLIEMSNVSQETKSGTHPLIDYELLARYGEGLIVLTGCIGGPVAGPLSRITGEVPEADAAEQARAQSNLEALIAA